MPRQEMVITALFGAPFQRYETRPKFLFFAPSRLRERLPSASFRLSREEEELLQKETKAEKGFLWIERLSKNAAEGGTRWSSPETFLFSSPRSPRLRVRFRQRLSETFQLGRPGRRKSAAPFARLLPQF